MTPGTGIPAPDIELAGRLFDELAARTGNGDGITRPSYGIGEQIGHDLLRRQGERMGFRVETDAACNLYLTLPGRYPGKRIIIGSHLDSVPRGGNFDGAAGVLCGLSVVSGLATSGMQAPCDITLMAIRAEESTWFPSSYIGSRAAFGQLARRELAGVRRTSDETALGDAIAAAGGDVDRLVRGEAWLCPADIRFFIEPHIEQGPCLVSEGMPVGIVTGIRGSFRYRSARCLGSYSHSGATPRRLRRDAVAATAELVMEMNRLWGNSEENGDDLSITFGKFGTDPAQHAFSKVAGQVDFAVDVRSQSTESLDRTDKCLLELVGQISGKHSVRFDLGPRTGSRPASMNEEVISSLHSACRAESAAAMSMPSGAGHDAAVFADLGVPTGMLFIRNRNGSHNPDETMEMEDFAVAARVLMRVCLEPPS